MLTKRTLSKAFTVIILLLLNGCASPSLKYELLVENYELIQKTQMGLGYEHFLIHNGKSGDKLHIYVEGDGLPWQNRYQISPNPTPRNPLALNLLTQDTNFALYVGRPCYFNLHSSQNCSPQQWTNGRYGADIVDSMEKVIRNFLDSHQINQVVFIGYSGGGVITSLLANRFEETQLLISIAANLDINRWTTLHSYSPLDQSLNPAEIIQSFKKPSIYLGGGKDTIVPIHLNKDFLNKIDSELIVFPEFDHSCCWQQNWPGILERILEKDVMQ